MFGKLITLFLTTQLIYEAAYAVLAKSISKVTWPETAKLIMKIGIAFQLC